MSTTRSIRQNNWLNIKTNTRNKWVGKAQHQPGDDIRFERFDQPENSIRAGALLLQSYQDKHKVDTVLGAITRYAPAGKENPHQTSYIRYVAEAVGVDDMEPLDFQSWETVRPMLQAMAEFEQGKARLPAGYERVIDAGLAQAGVLPQPKPLTQSRTVGGVGISGAGGLAGAASVAATGLGLINDESSMWMVAGVVTLVLVGSGITIWAYLDDMRRMRRAVM